MNKPQGRQATSFTRAREPAVPYGLTAVTLGELLKDQLNEVVAATAGGNRSKIIREALERYFEQLPELEKQRKDRQQKIRDRAFVIVLGRVLPSIKLLLESFDFGDDVLPYEKYDDVMDTIRRLEEWIDSQMANERLSGLKVPELEDALCDFEHGCLRLWRVLGREQWGNIVDRWRGVYKRENAGPRS